MNHWIFQAKPERYDLRDANNLRPGDQEDWVASRYRSKMRPGDLVFFWLAGPPDIRGIYGWGQLKSRPFSAKGGSRVSVTYRKRLSEFLPASALKKTKALGNLLILRLAVGTNFELSPSEAKAIAHLLKSSERPGGF